LLEDSDLDALALENQDAGASRGCDFADQFGWWMFAELPLHVSLRNLTVAQVAVCIMAHGTLSVKV
jgi:hypothetical protein